MVVLITSHNVREREADGRSLYLKNLESVFSQSYDRYRVIYVDDASTDGTGEAVARFITAADREHRVELVRRARRMGQLHNRHAAIHGCRDDELVVNLDGDDWFAHDGALERIAAEYRDPDTWMTYGQYARWCPRCQLVGPPDFFRRTDRCLHVDMYSAPLPPPEFIAENRWREYVLDHRPANSRWVFGHPFSFYASLFKQIAKSDLQLDGRFYQRGTDIAATIPMVELAGRHVRFIPEVLYIYNNDHLPRGAERDARGRPSIRSEDPRFFHHAEMRAKRPYQPLDRLPGVGGSD